MKTVDVGVKNLYHTALVAQFCAQRLEIAPRQPNEAIKGIARMLSAPCWAMVFSNGEFQLEAATKEHRETPWIVQFQICSDLAAIIACHPGFDFEVKDSTFKGNKKLQMTIETSVCKSHESHDVLRCRMTWWRWSALISNASNACNLAPANLLGSFFHAASIAMCCPDGIHSVVRGCNVTLCSRELLWQHVDAHLHLISSPCWACSIILASSAPCMLSSGCKRFCKRFSSIFATLPATASRRPATVVFVTIRSSVWVPASATFANCYSRILGTSAWLS